MTKYATYAIFKHKITGEVKRIPLSELEEELEKLASSEWEQLDAEE